MGDTAALRPMDMASVVMVGAVQEDQFGIIAQEDMVDSTPSQKCLRSHHRESASEWIVAGNRNRRHDSEPETAATGCTQSRRTCTLGVGTGREGIHRLRVALGRRQSKV